MSTIEEIKKKLTFDLWSADFWDPVFVFELERLDEADAKDENPEVYYGWKKLLEYTPREEAVKWLSETCCRIGDGELYYDWNNVTKKFEY